VPLAPKNTTLFPEYAPYGLAQIQAAVNSSKLPNRTDDKGVMICIIDSGLDIGHPDMKVRGISTADTAAEHHSNYKGTPKPGSRVTQRLQRNDEW
jgi:hypothetical protein